MARSGLKRGGWIGPHGNLADKATARLGTDEKRFLREHKRWFRERLAGMSDPTSRLYCGAPGVQNARWCRR